MRSAKIDLMTMEVETTSPPNLPPIGPPAVPPILQYLDGLVDQLRLHVASVIDAGPAESVHQARVTTRRLRAASDLLRPILAGKSRERLNHVLRRVRRRLGAIRDLDVLTEHLAEFTSNPEPNPDIAPAAEWMCNELLPTRGLLLAAAQDDKTIARLLIKLAPWGKVRGQILAHAEAVDSLLAESLHDQIDTFAARAAELAAAAPGVDPHAVRIAGKALRYTLELAAAHGHPLDESLFKTFKKMQDALGTWHDHVVFTEQALQRSAERMLAHHDAPLQHKILALAGATLTEAEAQLAKFNRHWAEHGAGLVDSIRAAFPLSRPIDDTTEPKTDPDPADSAAPEVPDGPH